MANKQIIHFLQDYDVPASSVYSFFSDHNRLTEIYPGFIRRVVDSQNPKDANDVGSTRVLFTFPILFTETTTVANYPSYLEYKITFGSPLKNHIGKMNFIDLGNNKSRLDYIIEFEPLLPFTGFLIKNILEKAVGDAIRELALRFKNNPNY